MEQLPGKHKVRGLIRSPKRKENKELESDKYAFRNFIWNVCAVKTSQSISDKNICLGFFFKVGYTLRLIQRWNSLETDKDVKLKQEKQRAFLHGSFWVTASIC